MINRLDDLKPGWKYSPTEIAPLFPKRDPRFIRQLCADGELKHTTTVGRGGKPNYWISGDAVRAWLRRNEKKAA